MINDFRAIKEASDELILEALRSTYSFETFDEFANVNGKNIEDAKKVLAAYKKVMELVENAIQKREETDRKIDEVLDLLKKQVGEK